MCKYRRTVCFSQSPHKNSVVDYLCGAKGSCKGECDCCSDKHKGYVFVSEGAVDGTPAITIGGRLVNIIKV